MNDTLMMAFGQAGAFAAIAIAAFGSSLGIGAAGAAAIGAWKKCYAQNKTAPFQLAVFVGLPLSQTIYGLILMIVILGAFKQPEQWPFFLILGIIGGLAIGASAWMQGKAAAGACNAFADTGKGFANYITALGIIETVALFVMAFGLVIIGMTAKSLTFDVEIGGQAAEYENELFAKITKPVKPDANIIVQKVNHDIITVEVLPCDENGNVSQGTRPAGIIKMESGANMATLLQAKDIQPGTYILNIFSGKKQVRVFAEIKTGNTESK